MYPRRTFARFRGQDNFFSSLPFLPMPSPGPNQAFFRKATQTWVDGLPARLSEPETRMSIHGSDVKFQFFLSFVSKRNLGGADMPSPSMHID